MEHAKKLVLVSRETIDRLERIAEGKLNSVQTPGNESSRVDASMSHVLHSEMKDDSEKWKLFAQQLQRFLNMNRASEHVEHLPPPPKKLQRQLSMTSRDQLLDLIPQKFKAKVEKLVRKLYESDKISWDDDGIVTINDKVLVGSHIVDLLNDAARPRKDFSPRYRTEFAKLLREINTPKELVGNKALWNLGESFAASSTTSSPDFKDAESTPRKRRQRWATMDR